MQRNIIPLLSRFCKRPVFFSCLIVSFSFPKRVVFFNAVSITCATEIPFLSYLAGPQCRCSSGLKRLCWFFYIYKVIVVFEWVCVWMCTLVHVCMYEHKMWYCTCGSWSKRVFHLWNPSCDGWFRRGWGCLYCIYVTAVFMNIGINYSPHYPQMIILTFDERTKN